MSSATWPCAPASTLMLRKPGTRHLDRRDAVSGLEPRRHEPRELARRLPRLLGELERDVGGVVAVALLARALDRDRLGHAAGQRDRTLGGEVRQGGDDQVGELLGGHRARVSAPARRPRPTSACRIGATPVMERRRARRRFPPPPGPPVWSSHLSPRSSGDRAPPSGGGSEGSNPSGGASKHERVRSSPVSRGVVTAPEPAHHALSGNSPAVVRRRGTHPARSSAATCSATIIVGRFVVAVGMVGMIEASATVRPATPWTAPRSSVTAPARDPAPWRRCPPDGGTSTPRPGPIAPAPRGRRSGCPVPAPARPR